MWNNLLELRQHPTALEVFSHLHFIFQRIPDRRVYMKTHTFSIQEPRYCFIENHKKIEHANHMHSFSHDKRLVYLHS